MARYQNERGRYLGATLGAMMVFACLAASCGSSQPPGPDAGTAGPSPDSVGPTPAPTANAGAGGAPTATATAPPVPPVPTGDPPAPATPSVHKPMMPSEHVQALRDLGLDPKKLPKMAALPIATKKKLMPLFKSSLGYDKCTGCHVDGDFKADTRNLQIAERMWDDFVVPLSQASGEALFCDSCHHGSSDNLDRHDPEAVKTFMKEVYVANLTLADGSGVKCSTCHGEDVKLAIFDEVWGVLPSP